MVMAFCATLAMAQAPAHQIPPPVEIAPAPDADSVAVAEQIPEALETSEVLETSKADSAAVAEPAAQDTARAAFANPEPEPADEQTIVIALAAPSEPIKFELGLRAGIGISSFRDHKALVIGNSAYAIIPGIDYSYSIGLASAIVINDFFSIAPELQYSFYSASNEYTIDEPFADFDEMNEAYVYMHSIELPVLLRFKTQSLYFEVGPQLGYNLYAKIYKNNKPYKPDVIGFAFGPSAGFGINLNDILLGIRGYLGITEYAENSEGYPWSAQVSLTIFFF